MVDNVTRVGTAVAAAAVAVLPRAVSLPAGLALAGSQLLQFARRAPQPQGRQGALAAPQRSNEFDRMEALD